MHTALTLPSQHAQMDHIIIGHFSWLPHAARLKPTWVPSTGSHPMPRGIPSQFPHTSHVEGKSICLGSAQQFKYEPSSSQPSTDQVGIKLYIISDETEYGWIQSLWTAYDNIGLCNGQKSFWYITAPYARVYITACTTKGEGQRGICLPLTPP